jgi:hypothetical protein
MLLFRECMDDSSMGEGRTMQDAYMEVGGRAKQEARAELLS